MQKLSDREFKAAASVIVAYGDAAARGAVRKLLANYQEQLEAESYVKLERYTEANTCTTTLDLNIQVKP